MENLQVVINQTNLDLSYKDSDAVVELTKYDWLNKNKKLVSLNGISNINIKEASISKVLPLNIDFQLRGVQKSQNNDDGINAEFFGSILVAIKKGELDWDSDNPAFYSFEGIKPFIGSEYNNIYIAQRVSQITLKQTPDQNLVLGQDEDVLILLTPISSLAQFQNASLVFTETDFSQISTIDRIRMVIPKYSKINTITAKGISNNETSDFDFKIKPNGKYILGMLSVIPDQVNEKVIFYSPWIDRSFTLPFSVSKTFLSSAGKNLKSLYNFKIGAEVELYKSLMTSIILTKEFLDGFPSFSRDANNKLDPKAEINGIFLTGLEGKDGISATTNALFRINRTFSEDSETDIFVFTRNIINMLSVIINSDYATNEGNNKLNEYLDPFYFFPRSSISVEIDDKQKVTTASLIQDFNVSLASKYYTFSSSVNAISKLKDNFKELSISTPVTADVSYNSDVMPDVLSAIEYTTNPADRTSDVSGSGYRVLFPVDTHQDLEELFSIKKENTISLGRSSITTKSFYLDSKARLVPDAGSAMTDFRNGTTAFKVPSQLSKYFDPAKKNVAVPLFSPVRGLASNEWVIDIYKQATDPNLFPEGDNQQMTTEIFLKFQPFLDTFGTKEKLKQIILPDLPAGAELFKDASGNEDISLVVSGLYSAARPTISSQLSPYLTELKDITISIQYTYVAATPNQPSAKHPSPAFLSGRFDKSVWNNFINQHLSSPFDFDLIGSDIETNLNINKLSEIVIRGSYIDDVSLFIDYTNQDGTKDKYILNHLETDALEDESIAVVKLLLNIGKTQ